MKISNEDKLPFLKVNRLNESLTNYVKYSVPSSYKFFENYSWYIHKRFVKSLVQLASDSDVLIEFSNISESLHTELADGVTGAQVVSQPDLHNVYAKLYLLPNAPLELVKLVYKKLAFMHHPDTGDGNTERFQEITEAYEIISRR